MRTRDRRTLLGAIAAAFSCQPLPCWPPRPKARSRRSTRTSDDDHAGRRQVLQAARRVRRRRASRRAWTSCIAYDEVGGENLITDMELPRVGSVQAVRASSRRPSSQPQHAVLGMSSGRGLGLRACASTSLKMARMTPPWVTQTVGRSSVCEPRPHALQQHLVALGVLAGRHEVPLVDAARACVEPGSRVFEFGEGEALPVAEMHFDQARRRCGRPWDRAPSPARTRSIVSRVRRIGLATKSNACGSPISSASLRAVAGRLAAARVR